MRSLSIQGFRVSTGTGEFRMIHSRVSWMLAPVDRSIIVSAPQMVLHCSFSTSCLRLFAAALAPYRALKAKVPIEPESKEIEVRRRGLIRHRRAQGHLLNGRADRGVPDVGVDLAQELAPCNSKSS